MDEVQKRLCAYLVQNLDRSILAFEEWCDKNECEMGPEERRIALATHLASNLCMGLPEAFPVLRGDDR